MEKDQIDPIGVCTKKYFRLSTSVLDLWYNQRGVSNVFLKKNNRGQWKLGG